jgi:hypothetical protein
MEHPPAHSPHPIRRDLRYTCTLFGILQRKRVTLHSVVLFVPAVCLSIHMYALPFHMAFINTRTIYCIAG